MYQKISVKGVDQPLVRRLADNAFIPFDPDNTDYQRYLVWLSEGNQPLPADQPTQPQGEPQ